MTPEIALLLAQDGITTGAIYVLVALGLVLIFLVTRVIFVPFGDVVGYSALTLAALQLRQTDGTPPMLGRAAQGIKGSRPSSVGDMNDVGHLSRVIKCRQNRSSPGDLSRHQVMT